MQEDTPIEETATEIKQAEEALQESAHYTEADLKEVVDSTGTATGERVVVDFDADGNEIGWHKEAIS